MSTDYKLDTKMPAEGNGLDYLHDLNYRDHVVLVVRAQVARESKDVDNPQPRLLRIRQIEAVHDGDAEKVAEILTRAAEERRGQLAIDSQPSHGDLVHDADELLEELDLNEDEVREHLTAVGAPEGATITGLTALQLRELRARLDEVVADRAPAVETVELPEFSDDEPAEVDA